MILTESDLHAYNRGELSPEATRLLESDPLAMEDAARLRAISMALRAEATIPVTGRAETLERLRARNAKGIGVPRWVWGVGVACVVGAVAVSLPPQTLPGFRIQRVVYAVPEGASDFRPLSTGAQSSEASSLAADASGAPGIAEAASAGATTARAEPVAKGGSVARAPRRAPSSVDRAQVQSQGAKTSPAKISLQVPDLASGGNRVETEIQALGGRIVSDQVQNRSRTIQTSLDPSHAETLRARLAPSTEATPSSKRPSGRRSTPQIQPPSMEARSPSASVVSPRATSSASGDSAKASVRSPPSSASSPGRPDSTLEITLTTPSSAPGEILPPASPRDLRPWLGALGLVALSLGGASVLLRRRRRS